MAALIGTTLMRAQTPHASGAFETLGLPGTATLDMLPAADARNVVFIGCGDARNWDGIDVNTHWQRLAQHATRDSRRAPNQVNHLLAFPGLFRGALDALASKVPEKMKLAAAHAIVVIVGDERSAEYVIPSVFDGRAVAAVAAAVRNTAVEEGLARRSLLLVDDDSILAAAHQ